MINPLILTDAGLRAVAPILPEVKAFCESHPSLVAMSESDLEMELVRTFRQRLLEEVCEPNKIYMGACIVMLIEALRLEKVIH